METVKTLTQAQLKKRSVKQLISIAKSKNYSETTQMSAIITAANRKTFDKTANIDLLGRYEAYKADLEAKAKKLAEKNTTKTTKKTSTKNKAKTSKRGFNGKPRGRFNHPDVKNNGECFIEIKGEKVLGKLLYCNRNSTEYCVVEVCGKKYEKALSKVTKA